LLRTYTVIALDLPGHGRTDKPRIRYDYDFFSTFVHDFMAALGISKATLFGHSMGGMIALYFCTRYPTMVEKTVLIAPAYGTRFPFFLHLITVPLIGELLLRPPSSREAVRKAFRILTLKPLEYDPDCLDCYYEFQHQPGYAHAMLSYPRGVINLFGLTRKGRRYAQWFERELPKLDLPFLVIWGKQDKVVPFGNADSLMALIRNGAFCEVAECGHCPHFEYAEDFNRKVEEFLMARRSSSR
jgi:pimeloyl-ACP methyl ester carboxylesterase